MTFGGFGKNGEDWEVHVFRADSYTGELIDCGNLTKGAYYLNYDNKNEKFLKK